MNLSNWKLKLKVDQPNYIIARNTSDGDTIYISGVFQSKENAIKELNVRLENHKQNPRPEDWGEPFILELKVVVNKI